MFKNKNISLDFFNVTCHSGGAKGSDTIWEEQTILHGGKVKAYSYKTKYHNSVNKVEVNEKDYKEGILKVHEANKVLKRKGHGKYMNLLSRNWSQIKYSDQVLAIGNIVNSLEENERGYINNSDISIVDGGTGFTVIMGILSNKDIYVLNQKDNKWYRWSYITNEFIFIKDEKVIIEFDNFAGIGTRNITDQSIKKVKEVFLRSINVRVKLSESWDKLKDSDLGNKITKW